MNDRSTSTSETGSVEVVLTLPDANRSAFKDPLGSIFTEETAVCERAGRPLITIGDIVTASLVDIDCIPDIAIVDGLTKRRPIGSATQSTLEELNHPLEAVNPAGTITASLIEVIQQALSLDPPVKIVVDGEEDLAVLPAILAAPAGATVIYGQPDEGMVIVHVNTRRKEAVSGLLDFLEGDRETLRALMDE